MRAPVPFTKCFHADDQRTYTRAWFGWGNALFSELVLDLTGRSTAALHPSLPR